MKSDPFRPLHLHLPRPLRLLGAELEKAIS